MAWGRIVFKSGGEEYAFDLGGAAPPDLDDVHAVARICLLTGRLGWETRVREPTPDLVALIDLVGLRETLIE